LKIVLIFPFSYLLFSYGGLLYLTLYDFKGRRNVHLDLNPWWWLESSEDILQGCDTLQYDDPQVKNVEGETKTTVEAEVVEELFLNPPNQRAPIHKLHCCIFFVFKN
jgi:hypothetical protein